jgi:hypothetical protein
MPACAYRYGRLGMSRQDQFGPIILAVLAFVLASTPQSSAQFETRAGFGAQEFPFSIAVGDFNRDGKPDLAVASCDTSTGYATDIQVLIGNGDGTFQPAVRYTVGTCPGSVATADFNHDGYLDLVASNSQTDNVSVL